jgi:integrase
LPKQHERRAHHAALPYNEVPAFIAALRKTELGRATQLAFELLVLTVARTSEVLMARWDEIDLDRAIWTIPATRTKTARQHRVPLSERCLEILREAKKLAGDNAYVFPGRSDGKPLSNMAFLMTLRRMRFEVTAHGFRSSFRDWASERTSFPGAVCELALGHSIKDKTEAAYRRGDLLDTRRKLMESWATFATPAQADVVPIRSSR